MDVDKELEQFVLSSVNHGKATENGDHKEANKQYKKIHKSSAQLLSNLDVFVKLLEHENSYVRLWAGSYLIHVEGSARRAQSALEQLQGEKGFLGFDAQMVLKEWKNKH